MLFKGVFEDVLSFETTTVQKTIPHTPPQQPQPTTTTTNDGADGGHGVHGAVKPSDGGDTNTATYIKVVVKQVRGCVHMCICGCVYVWMYMWRHQVCAWCISYYTITYYGVYYNTPSHSMCISYYTIT